jgi:hypothetical protein
MPIGTPFQGDFLARVVPRAEALGFYEADFVKTGGEYCFLFIFCSFQPTSGDSPPVWLWCLIISAGVCAAAVIKRQSQLLLPARNVVGSRRATE